jgi:tetratricopeptide (TPR) repeat protein
LGKLIILQVTISKVSSKSQVAIQYAYSVRDSKQQPFVSVDNIFWIHASNLARFEQGYREIASKVQIPGRDNPETDIFHLVHGWLSDDRNGHWIMLIDNIDDEDFLFEFETSNPKSKPLESFIPRSRKGMILFTSRNQLAVPKLGVAHDKIIPVEPLVEADALNLLKTRIPADSDNDALELVQALEYIPLAIIQAGAYIATRASRFTISRYLDLFRKSEVNQIKLLNTEAKDSQRDYSIQHAVIKTWQISFEQIRSTTPEAVDVLALMSMFDRYEIPETLLKGDMDDLEFEDALTPLLSFSLVTTQRERNSFDMHRLVQLSTNKWLEINKKLDTWRKKSVLVMAEVFPMGNDETRKECQELYPHAKRVISNISSNETENIDTLTHKVGCYAYLAGKYKEADAMCRQALKIREQLLGIEHLDTIDSMNNLAMSLEKQGMYQDAKEMHERVMISSLKLLGPKDPSTLNSVNNLGVVLERLGKYSEAEHIHRRLFKIQEEVLGAEHPDTLKSASNLGLVLERQGKYGEAESMHRQAFLGSRVLQGVKSSSTLASMENLGAFLLNQGNYDEAEAMLQEVLKLKEEVLGPDHPSTLTTLNNLGHAFKGQGKYKEAEELYRQDLEKSRTVLGPDHPEVLHSLNNLGLVLDKLGKYQEAESIHREALKIKELVLGPDHPNTVISVNNIGLVLRSQGKYEEAESMHRRALRTREQILGVEHPHTLDSISKLGIVLKDRHKYEEAETLCRRALKIKEKTLGCEHLSTLMTIDNLGIILRAQGKSDEAKLMHEQAFKAREEILGPKHPDTLRSLNNLALVLRDQGEYDKAECLHRRELGVSDELGSENLDTYISIYNLGTLLKLQGKIDEAEAMLQRSTAGFEKILGSKHPHTLKSLDHLNSIHEETKDDWVPVQQG